MWLSLLDSQPFGPSFLVVATMVGGPPGEAHQIIVAVVGPSRQTAAPLRRKRAHAVRGTEEGAGDGRHGIGVVANAHRLPKARGVMVGALSGGVNGRPCGLQCRYDVTVGIERPKIKSLCVIDPLLPLRSSYLLNGVKTNSRPDQLSGPDRVINGQSPKNAGVDRELIRVGQP